MSNPSSTASRYAGTCPEGSTTATLPLATPPVTEKPPYTDGTATIYRSARSETLVIHLPTSNYSFRPPLGTVDVSIKAVESASKATLIRTADNFDKMTGLVRQDLAQPSAATAIGDLHVAVRNDDVRSCDRAQDVTHTKSGTASVQLATSQSETDMVDMAASILDAFTDVTPCGGPKTGSGDIAELPATISHRKATAQSTEEQISVLVSAPGPANTSVTHTRSSSRQTSLYDIGRQRHGNINSPPSLHTPTDAPIPTLALLTHLRLYHQETTDTTSNPATQANLPATALLTLTLTTLLSTSPQRFLTSPRKTLHISRLRPPLLFLTAILTIFSLTTVSAALPINTTLPPQHPSTNALFPRTIDANRTSAPTTTATSAPNTDEPLHSLPRGAAAAIWAVTAFAFLLALAVLIWFCGVKVCWARWSERRRKERRERDLRWWLR